MRDVFEPVIKQSLSDRLAHRIHAPILAGEYQEGDRLPSITEMARRFGVGHPTLREALKKLEAMRIVEIRHGSGVYVLRGQNVLVFASPHYAGTATKTALLDLIQVRMPLELLSASRAAAKIAEEHLAEIRRLLARAGDDLEDDARLLACNMRFHREVALASGSAALHQLLGVLYELFAEEQSHILDIFGSREHSHAEHLGIVEALERHDEELAIRRMREHLEGVQDALLRWDPERHPVA